MTMAAVSAPDLVLAVGNPSRGDDAVGPRLAERLQAWLGSPEGAPWAGQVEVICDLQLMVEHTLDVQGRRRVLFVDAAASGAPAVRLQPVLPTPTLAVSSHQCTPAQLLGLLPAALQIEPPPADLLAVGGEQFELGAGLSDAVSARLETAWGALRAWVRAPVGG